MPNIPTYESQLGVARNVGGRYRINERTFLPQVTGFGQIGDVLQRRGEQLLQEYDTTRAIGAYNQIRDNSRTKLSELLQREGVSAQGVQNEYNEWYRKQSQSIQTDNLTVDRQKKIFSEMSEKRRQGDLDRLAVHEAQQHQAYKKEVIKGLAATIERDIPEAAFDDAKQNEMIADYFNVIESLYPGHDVTAEKAEILESLKFTVAKELIDKNEDYAAGWIEKNKKDLGDKYYTLKEALKQKSTQARTDAAIAVLHEQFGVNHEYKIATILNPNNWKKYKIKTNDEAEEVARYFRSMAADRDAAESKMEDAISKRQRDTEMQILVEMFDPDTVRTLDPHQEAQKGNIRNDFYRWINSPSATETVVDDWELIGQIYESSLRGNYNESKQMISEGAEKGAIKGTTAVQMVKKLNDVRYSRAAQMIIQALKPAGLFDRYASDKQLRLVEAFDHLYTVSSETDRPVEDIASDIVKSYKGHVSRTTDNIPTPRLLVVPKGASVRDMKQDIEALGAAKRATVAYMKRGLMGPEEYHNEMKNIELLIENAREVQDMQAFDSGLEELKKQVVD